MELLLDENLSPLFIEKIKKLYPGSVDVYDIGFTGKSDHEIYCFLKKHRYVLMTFDLDFSDIRKFPPDLVEGIIVLRFKNKKIRDLITETLVYLKKLASLDFKNSLIIFQDSGIRLRKKLKVLK